MNTWDYHTRYAKKPEFEIGDILKVIDKTTYILSLIRGGFIDSNNLIYSVFKLRRGDWEINRDFMNHTWPTCHVIVESFNRIRIGDTLDHKGRDLTVTKIIDSRRIIEANNILFEVLECPDNGMSIVEL